MRVLVLGAGFGGLEVAASLSERFGDDLDLVLIDKSDAFVFGFAKLDVMFGRSTPEAVLQPYAGRLPRGVRFVRAAIRAIDPVARRVATDAGSFVGDLMVVALGADLHPRATPGFDEGGHDFYSVPGAFALGEVLAEFAGGDVVVGVTSTPFKCPPAPSETALLVDELLVARGVRDLSTVSLVLPLPLPVPPSPRASEALLAAFEDRKIAWYPDRVVRALDVARRQVVLSDGVELPYDLFLGVPTHRVPAVVQASGLAVDGWVPVDPRTMETRFPGVYAVGDVTSVGTPKAGVFAEGQAAIAAARIAAVLAGTSCEAAYDGKGTCYVDFGDGTVGKADVTFRPGERPSGEFEGPSADLVADKVAFGTSRVRRWFPAESDHGV